MAVVSGVLQWLPFPIAGPVPLWRTAFCWIALLPLLAALLGRDKNGEPLRTRDGALLGFCSGIVWYFGNCFWIYATMHQYGGISKPVSLGILFLFCLYLGLYHALFGAIFASFRVCRFGEQGALLLSPFVWVAVELARARITGLPWDLLGIAQVDNPLLTRLAPITGAYGISFVVAAVNALWMIRISLREQKHTRTVLALSGVAIIVVYILSLRRMEMPIERHTSATATLLQSNLAVGIESAGSRLTKGEMLQDFSRLSVFPPRGYCMGIPEMHSTTCIEYLRSQGDADGAPLKQPTDLIVWPESPAPFEESDPEFRDAMSQLAHEAKAPIIVGNIGIDSDPNVKRGYDLHNSADFIQPEVGFVGRYDKIHLVPFGEYVPFKKLFFFAGNLLQDVGTFDPGKTRTLFRTGGHTYGTFICYESIFGDEVRHFADEGADVLVNISDDGWYGDSGAPWQHLNMVRMRALENHRWVLRATNTGVTASIDPAGRVVESAHRHERTSLRVGFNYEHDVTFYAKHGDWFAYLCAGVTLGGLGYGWLRKAAVR